MVDKVAIQIGSVVMLLVGLVLVVGGIRKHKYFVEWQYRGIFDLLDRGLFEKTSQREWEKVNPVRMILVGLSLIIGALGFLWAAAHPHP